ncbi:MAG TPA: hypothetical protein VMH83_02160 [Candidatus Acidoferrum sp.]|nr:hypothetical protein [Candidatus Acidoferrum sp.]
MRSSRFSCLPAKIALLLLALLYGMQAGADQNDPRLSDLFRQLHDASDPAAAAPIEDAIWRIWLHHDDPHAQQLMMRGVGQLNAGDLPAALATFTELVKLTPDFAEAWNKRATVYYLMENYAASERDIQQTLKLEPLHFGALSGRGLVKLGQRDLIGARNAFNAVLEVYPAMTGVQRDLDQLNQLLKRNSI